MVKQLSSKKIFFKEVMGKFADVGTCLQLPMATNTQQIPNTPQLVVMGWQLPVGGKGACLGFADVVMVHMRVGKEFPDMRQNKIY